MFRYLLLAATILLFSGCARIDETEHCVLVRYGNVIEERMKEGLVFLPIADAECFPLVDQNYPSNVDMQERVSAQTSDPVTVTGDLAVVWAYDPAMVFQVFREKRTHKAVQVEVVNSIREGYRTALAGWEVTKIFSRERSALSDTVRAHIQRKLGTRGVIKTVFLREITIPEQIENARISAAQQEQVLDKARKQFAIDSVNARAEIVKADANAELTRIQSQIYAKNPEMMRLEVERARAEALGKVCSGAQTCILGGSVMDTWRGAPK